MKLYIFLTLYFSTMYILAEINPRRMAAISKVVQDVLRCDRKYSGKKLMKILGTYNDYLEEILRNVDEYTNIGLRQYKVLLKQKGPPHMNTVFNRNRVQVMLNFTSDEVLEAELAHNRSRELWEEIQETYDNRTYDYERTAILVDNYTFIPAPISNASQATKLFWSNISQQMQLHAANVLFLLTISILAELDPRKMLKLGKTLEEMLLYKEKQDGNKLMRRLLRYNEYLSTVLKEVENETSLGNKLYKTLDRDLGPPHLKSKMYNILMHRMFNLTFEEVEEAENIVEKTRQLWNQVQYVVGNRTLET